MMEIIAEVGLAHDGSLLQAHAYIDACAKAGVDAVKFQCHMGDECDEWRNVQHTWRAETRQDYWKRTEFTEQEWTMLAYHCAEAGVEFLCSVFSLEAFALIDPLVKRHKVPSGQITNKPLLKAIAKTSKPTLISTGMSTSDELTAALRIFDAATVIDTDYPLLILQCTTMYPCPPELVGLPATEWGGLSDHSGTIYSGIAAAVLGCKVLEVHVCFSREAGGLDGAASLEMAELRQLVQGVRFVEKAMQPVDKDQLAAELAETRRIFMHA